MAKILTSNSEIHSSEYVTLRDYIDKCFELRDQAQVERDRAVNVAYKNMEQRQNASNEIRGALQDVINKTLTRDEHTIIKDRLDRDVKFLQDDIKSLRESRAELAGKADQVSVNRVSERATLSITIGAVGLVFSFISLVIVIIKMLVP